MGAMMQVESRSKIKRGVEVLNRTLRRVVLSPEIDSSDICGIMLWSIVPVFSSNKNIAVSARTTRAREPA